MINQLDTEMRVHHRLYRQHSLPWGPVFIKDLSRLGPRSRSFHPGRASDSSGTQRDSASPSLSLRPAQAGPWIAC